MPLLHRSLTTTLFGLLALTAVSPSRAQLLDATWIGPATGDWSDAANWSTGVVPDLGAYAVRIDANAAQATTVGVDGQFTVFDLSLDEGDRISLAEGALLELDDVSTIAGEVRIAPTASLLARSLLRIEPTGRIRLEPGEEGAGVALLSRGPGGDDRWNHGVIEGAGVVQTTGGFFNLGAIEANVDGRDLTLIRLVRRSQPADQQRRLPGHQRRHAQLQRRGHAGPAPEPDGRSVRPHRSGGRVFNLVRHHPG